MSANVENVELNLDDPFHAAIWSILKTHDKKGHDYAVETDQFSNFRGTARYLGMETQPWIAADFLEVTKLERLMSLRYNGRTPANESVQDTYMDKAVYAVLAYAMLLQQKMEERV